MVGAVRHRERFAGLIRRIPPSLLAEFERVTHAVKGGLLAQLAEQGERHQEMEELLGEYEIKLELLKKELTRKDAAFEARQLALEKALSAAEANTISSEKRFAALQAKCGSQLETLREKCHEAGLKAAIAETRATEYKKQINARMKKKEV